MDLRVVRMALALQPTCPPAGRHIAAPAYPHVSEWETHNEKWETHKEETNAPGVLIST